MSDAPDSLPTAEKDVPSCLCVSLMDTSKCPVHGANRWRVKPVEVHHCATCTCVTSPEGATCPHRVPVGEWCAGCDMYDEPATANTYVLPPEGSDAE